MHVPGSRRRARLLVRKRKKSLLSGYGTIETDCVRSYDPEIVPNSSAENAVRIEGNQSMKSQNLSDDFCLDYLTGELPAEEIASLDSHLEDCSDCRLRVQQYREILRQGLPSIADEAVEVGPGLPWSIEEGEKRLYAAMGQ